MRVVAIGECMVEFAPLPDGTYRRGFAGDTFNAAWYLARVRPGWSVDYLSAVGDDAASAAMTAFMEREGVGTAHVARLPGGTPGLYVITVEAGERSFAYWRSASAARCLADDPARLDAALRGADLATLSGITLAILPPDGRAALLAALDGFAGRVAFDPNLRPALWEDAGAMRAACDAACARADLVLPSFDEAEAAYGDASPEETARRLLALGAGAVAVKDGPRPALWAQGTRRATHAPAPVEPVDTTAAGDSFGAAAAAAWMEGAGPEACLAEGCALAGRVVRGAGALVREAVPGTPVPNMGERA